MKHLGVLFYSILALLTAAIIGVFSAWSFTKNDVFLLVMLGLFAVYIVFLVLALRENKKRAKGISEETLQMRELLSQEHVKTVFFSVYSMKRALKPAAGTHDYYIELHASENAEELTAHYAGILPEEKSAEIEQNCIGEYAVSFAVISSIRGKKIVCEKSLYAGIKDLPEYEHFIKQNKFHLYRGEAAAE